MENEKKNHKLSIFLLKQGISNYKDALKVSVIILGEYDFNEKIQENGKVIIGKTRTNEPNWKSLLQEGVKNQIPELKNSSNRAIAFFHIDGRIFAIPFGYGKHLLKEDVIDRDFGLKTALNIVNADKLVSVDKANIGDLSVLTRTQASKKGSPDAFEIDVVKDLLRSVTGEPTIVLPEYFGSIITGNEGIYISPKINMSKIPEILKNLKKEYAKDIYKDRFDWIDNIKNERDPAIIEQLRNNLVADLQARDIDKVHLAPPFIIEWENFEGISFTPKGEIYSEFSIEDYYEEKGDSLATLDWDKLYLQKIYTKKVEDDNRYSSSVWRFINYETEHNGFRYVFTLSNWYRIDKDYYEELYNYCKSFEESELAFIDCNDGDNEGKYNKYLADSNDDYILLDKDLVRSDLSRSGIEACDVFAKTKEFVHVKFRDSSATLSHLFAQGRVSSYSLRKDKTFRKNLRTKLTKHGLDKDLIPLENRDIKPSEYTITFAIIETIDRSFIDALPFFSLINFRLTADDLVFLGYNVRVKKILIV
jgi:uncharacterized protein (TIGR04141 family)